MTKPVRYVKVRDILGNTETRKLCGGVTRNTLITWRKSHGFPKPIRRLAGSGPAGVELWDAAEVRVWLQERAAAR